MKTRKVQKYECSNWFNPYSGQRYPVYINSVRYTEIVGKKTPNGMLCVSAEDVDGPVELVGVPISIRAAIVGCGARIAD